LGAPEQNPYWLGRYRLSARIATGGMAEVYLGRRIDANGQRGPAVAVKRLLPHLVSDRRIVQMFLNEARITAQVHHPNVVTILELGVEDTEPFIAMELLEGRSFAELRAEAAERGQRVPVGVTLRILVDACWTRPTAPWTRAAGPCASSTATSPRTTSTWGSMAPSR
jgi:hypothetical protein